MPGIFSPLFNLVSISKAFVDALATFINSNRFCMSPDVLIATSFTPIFCLARSNKASLVSSDVSFSFISAIISSLVVLIKSTPVSINSCLLSANFLVTISSALETPINSS